MENASKALIIAGAILISILIISLGVLVYNQASSTVSKANLNSQEAQAHNTAFENYFGTDVTASEAKNLLSEVRTNNLTASRNQESSTIGVVFVSNYSTVIANNNEGVYKTNLNPKNVKADTFNSSYNFCADVQSITNQLRTGTSYTINVPNSKAYTKDQEGTTGFTNQTTGEIAKSPNVQGYYSSGYIRLIYIIDNYNRT